MILKFDSIGPKTRETLDDIFIRKGTRKNDYTYYAYDIVLPNRSSNSEECQKENKSKPQRDKEPKSCFFLLKTRNQYVNYFLSKTIGNKHESNRKEEKSNYLEKEYETTICTSCETEVYETENEKM